MLFVIYSDVTVQAKLEEEIESVALKSRESEAAMNEEMHLIQTQLRDLKHKHEKILNQLTLKTQELDKSEADKVCEHVCVCTFH